MRLRKILRIWPYHIARRLIDAYKLFGTSGIRGNITTKVTVDLALRLGLALGTSLDGRGLVGVGTDARTSMEMLKGAFVSGLSSTGVDVIDLGIAPMPTVAYYSIQDGISASVMVTASHNPPTDNGFKFFETGREFLRSEEKILETSVSEGNFKVADWRDIGNVHKQDIRRSNLNRIKKFALDRGRIANGMKVLIDSANGAASEYTPHLLRELGFSVTTVNSHPDGHFPGRLPEPSPKNLQDTMKIAAESDFAVIVIVYEAPGTAAGEVPMEKYR